MEYVDYLKSEHWIEFREKAVQNAGRKCCLCATSGVELNVHHNNYECLWKEKFSDAAVLCKACHEKFHDVVPEPDVVKVIKPVETAVERLRERIDRMDNGEKRDRLMARLFIMESDIKPEEMARRLMAEFEEA